MLKIIGLAGETGAGKDYFFECAKKLAKRVYYFRFSDSLAEALKIFVDDIRKEDQQWLFLVLKERFGADILHEALLKKIRQIKSGLVVIHGLRFWPDYKMVKKLGGKVVYITADQKIRWRRVQKRGEKKDDSRSWQNFLRLEKVATELQIPQIGAKADFKIENNGTRQNFYNEVKKVIDSTVTVGGEW